MVAVQRMHSSMFYTGNLGQSPGSLLVGDADLLPDPLTPLHQKYKVPWVLWWSIIWYAESGSCQSSSHPLECGRAAYLLIWPRGLGI